MTLASVPRLSIALSTILCSMSIAAADFLRLSDDLDGDGKAEVVSVSVTGTGEFQGYLVRVGNAAYKGEFFAADGDLPKISHIRINPAEKGKQLLVTTIGPTDCHYEILSFHQGKIVHLLSHRSRDCDEPRFAGNGTVETLTPEGFWKRKDRYTLFDQAKKLKHDSQTIYPVERINVVHGVAGVATKLLSLKPAGCKNATIPSGDRIVVTDYDISKKQYLIKGSGETCGWLVESELPSSIDKLPWAG